MSVRRHLPDEEAATLLSDAGPRAAARSLTFRLSVVEGPDRGRELTIDGSLPSRVLVGKGPACTLRLSDPRASRRHAGLDLVEDGVRLVDLGSMNGTSVNGVRVMDAFLRGGELITMGTNVLRVDAHAELPLATLPTARGFGKLVGASVEMRRLYPLCERIAASDVPVLIEGETGTGKEVLAESLHEASARATQPFVVFDCTEVPPNLVESELFGHERGAFTGATGTRKGVFEQAHGGTLFIDEIGDLAPELQPKLLRAVERSEIRRVGGDKRIPLDVRVIAATRRDLDREVQEGNFRDDLFFRLVVTRIELPPLRERRGDVAVLARHFWKALGATSELPYEVLRQFEAYAWPGNARELRNAVARRLALGSLAEEEASSAEPPAIEPSSASCAIDRVLAHDSQFSNARERLLREFEQRFVEHALAQHGGNATRAAEACGLARRYFNVLRARRSPS